ncbi:MAG: nucleoside deaminase [Phycisphaerales bacterium]|nr:nucleoside deaminase [Phycisphaerales bacterium]
MTDEQWMSLAIEHARRGISTGQSPFGAVIVRGDTLVAAGHNQVWHRTDPTSHAEVVCIQRAAAAAKSIDLSGCRMYTTCEPCPMCAGAIHWARLDSVSYGACIDDAAQAGFNELHAPIRSLYQQGRSPVRISGGILAAQCAALFGEWKAVHGRGY